MLANKFTILALIGISIQSGFNSSYTQDKLDQKKIDQAVKKGCEWLLKNIDQAYGDVHKDHDWSCRAEIVLCALVYGGAFSEKDERCRKLLEYVLNAEPKYTYRAAIKAMALYTLDPYKYMEFIAQCGQALIDGQSKDGRWNYRLPVNGAKPKVLSVTEAKDKKFKLKRTQPFKMEGGDNSNSQYAALGLRACYDAGVELPEETLSLALKWWETSQFPEGTWRYHSIGGGIGTQSSDGDKIKLLPANEKADRRYAMTAGGISSIAIYRFLLGQLKKKGEVLKDAGISAGISWLAKNYKLIGAGTFNLDGVGDFYWLYGLERACILSEREKIGDHDWYKEGATWLIANQAESGQWGKGMVDTCFAILFLRRSTEPLATQQSIL